jgi:hypothetical protein
LTRGVGIGGRLDGSGQLDKAALEGRGLQVRRMSVRNCREH